MAVKWTFLGFDLHVTYTLPVPPGGTPVKERVQIANNIPTYAAALAQQQAARVMLEDIGRHLTDVGSPMEGWAPFSYGTTLVPDYLKTEVPD